MYKKAITIFLVLVLTSLQLFSLFNSFSASALNFSLNTSLSANNASFYGQHNEDQSGESLVIVEDVNGDGVDDILIGSPGNDQGGGNPFQFGDGAGKTYLIFGNASGRGYSRNLAKANASFVGEFLWDSSGYSVASAGDVNRDGLGDVLIGAHGSGTFGEGQTYLILGKRTGWTTDVPLGSVDASFKGQTQYESSGISVAGVGDVNGDGFDDILIGADNNKDNGQSSGKAYLILGKGSGFAMDTPLSGANASFYGENVNNYAGTSVAGAGDVNGDGYDDFLVASPGYSIGKMAQGKTYLFLGGPDKFHLDMNLSLADASFIGEKANDEAGICISGAGDVNGDGFDDILIGADLNDVQDDMAGQVYLIFGKAKGWTSNFTLGLADASFLGDAVGDYLGSWVSSAGDVNGDGYDDILMSAPGSNTALLNVGETYLVLGKPSGWGTWKTISLVASSSFVGINQGDYSGTSAGGTGDVDDDGYDDIMIASRSDGFANNWTGRSYLFFVDDNHRPVSITSIKVFSDPAFSQPVGTAFIGDSVYVEVVGTDGNSGRADTAEALVTSKTVSPNPFRLSLRETGPATGVYHGIMKVHWWTNGHKGWIGAAEGDTVTVTSYEDLTKNVSFPIRAPMVLRPEIYAVDTLEDEPFNITFNTLYRTPIGWSFKTNAPWLNFSKANLTVYGVPRNNDVGTYWAYVKVDGDLGTSDDINFTVRALNSPPKILGTNVSVTLEDRPYFIDYNSTDDGQGSVTWGMATNATAWLNLNKMTGTLSGIPTNDNLGRYYVNVTVRDGNGGSDSTNFSLTVKNVNDPPTIVTTDKTVAVEDEQYFVIYSATDVDPGDAISDWKLDSNASWLKLDRTVPSLSGLPRNEDVGSYYVNITARDLSLARDSHNFTLMVLNVNDPPEWTSVPENVERMEGAAFLFDINATDVDRGDVLTYKVSSQPPSNISINPSTGQLKWVATRSFFTAKPWVLIVIVEATDGNATITSQFTIGVIQNLPPEAHLLSPPNDFFLKGTQVALLWEGSDPESDPVTYTLYLSNKSAAVMDLKDEAIMAKGVDWLVFPATGLRMGMVYFWTVVPSDGRSAGRCVDGVFHFNVNTPPSLLPVGNRTVTVGEDLALTVGSSDNDTWDKAGLLYRLVKGPAGMQMDSRAGKITWSPTKEQIGEHIVVVQISDRLDVVNTSFVVTVVAKKVPVAPKSSLGTALAIGLVVAVVAVVSVLLIYRMKRRKQGPVQAGAPSGSATSLMRTDIAEAPVDRGEFREQV